MYSTDRRADWMAASLLPASDYITAQRVRATITAETDALLARYAAVIAPTMGSGASRIEPAAGAAPGGRGAGGGAGATGGGAAGGGRGTNRGPGPALTRLANITGIPGISIPCGLDADGLAQAPTSSRAWEQPCSTWRWRISATRRSTSLGHVPRRLHSPQQCGGRFV
jgi:aspartyl-tRNA(Asn)/glutamyl-tRNA(Gln) amidotransferase subunit A